MLSRRIPSANPGARGSFTRNPSSSGPRCPIDAAIRRVRASASELRAKKAAPQIPHTLLFDFRRAEKSRPGPRKMFLYVKPRYFQFSIGVPGKNAAHNKQKKRARKEYTKREEGFALQQQAPVKSLIPTRIDSVQQSSQP